MKFLLSASLLYGLFCNVGVANGFGIASKLPSQSSIVQTRRFAATGSFIDVQATVTPAKTYLLEVTERLNNEYGVFIIDSRAKEELELAVLDLEATATPFGYNYANDFIGDWTLVCTTATPSASSTSSPSFLGKGIDTSKLPFFNDGPTKDLRNALNKQVSVKQVIRSENGIDIDRVDHVLEYKPPNTLQEFFKNLPTELLNLNINPLSVSQGKLSLIHKAKVESVTPLITKLTLQSIVLSVAGTSQYLDPNGKDILGVNIPNLSEFLNSGTFETTYMDKDLRVSRGKAGLVEQLRVFVRKTGVKYEEDPLNENAGEVRVGGTTEETVSDTLFDNSDDDLSPSA